MKRLLILIGLAALCLGCATGGGGKPPEPPQPPANPSPICSAPDLVRNCWIMPPGEGWSYLCGDGLTKVTGPEACPVAPHPPLACEPLPGPGTCHEAAGQPGQHAAAVNRAIDAACAAEGVTCGQDGPQRPGAWDAFVERIGASLVGQGLCPTYDYKHGEAEGRASEMSVRFRGATSVESYQVETAPGRVRRPPGAFRSTCEGGGEGQAIRPAKPGAPPGATTCAPGTPPPGKYIVNCHVKPANPNAVFCDATPKVVSEREYCAPDVNCPYRGGEGSAARVACERALAWPVWSGADVRDDPFVADATRGARVRVCARDFPGACGDTVAP